MIVFLLYCNVFGLHGLHLVPYFLQYSKHEAFFHLAHYRVGSLLDTDNDIPISWLRHSMMDIRQMKITSCKHEFFHLAHYLHKKIAFQGNAYLGMLFLTHAMHDFML
jgi:hypothetical protein